MINTCLDGPKYIKGWHLRVLKLAALNFPDRRIPRGEKVVCSKCKQQLFPDPNVQMTHWGDGMECCGRLHGA